MKQLKKCAFLFLVFLALEAKAVTPMDWCSLDGNIQVMKAVSSPNPIYSNPDLYAQYPDQFPVPDQFQPYHSGDGNCLLHAVSCGEQNLGRSVLDAGYSCVCAKQSEDSYSWSCTENRGSLDQNQPCPDGIFPAVGNENCQCEIPDTLLPAMDLINQSGGGQESLPPGEIDSNGNRSCLQSCSDSKYVSVQDLDMSDGVNDPDTYFSACVESASSQDCSVADAELPEGMTSEQLMSSMMEGPTCGEAGDMPISGLNCSGVGTSTFRCGTAGFSEIVKVESKYTGDTVEWSKQMSFFAVAVKFSQSGLHLLNLWNGNVTKLEVNLSTGEKVVDVEVDYQARFLDYSMSSLSSSVVYFLTDAGNIYRYDFEGPHTGEARLMVEASKVPFPIKGLSFFEKVLMFGEGSPFFSEDCEFEFFRGIHFGFVDSKGTLYLAATFSQDRVQEMGEEALDFCQGEPNQDGEMVCIRPMGGLTGTVNPKILETKITTDDNPLKLPAFYWGFNGKSIGKDDQQVPVYTMPFAMRLEADQSYLFTPMSMEEEEGVQCHDGIDNDQDGLLDCEDRDCEGLTYDFQTGATCPSLEESSDESMVLSPFGDDFTEGKKMTKLIACSGVHLTFAPAPDADPEMTCPEGQFVNEAKTACRCPDGEGLVIDSENPQGFCKQDFETIVTETITEAEEVPLFTVVTDIVDVVRVKEYVTETIYVDKPYPVEVEKIVEKVITEVKEIEKIVEVKVPGETKIVEIPGPVVTETKIEKYSALATGGAMSCSLNKESETKETSFVISLSFVLMLVFRTSLGWRKRERNF